MLQLNCYGVTGISVCIQFCKLGQDMTVSCKQHPLNSTVITKREYGARSAKTENAITLQLHYWTLPQEHQCCSILEKNTEDRKDFQVSCKDLQIFQNIYVPTIISTPQAVVISNSSILAIFSMISKWKYSY